MALNPRMSLSSGGRSLRQTIRAASAEDTAARGESALAAVVARYEAQLAAARWAVYRVRRVYHREAIRTDRGLEAIATGDRSAMIAALARLGPVEELDGHPRVYLRRRAGAERPAVEEFFVAAPHVARDKAKRQFPTSWARATFGDPRPDPLATFARPAPTWQQHPLA